jgi:hypothetical protein
MGLRRWGQFGKMRVGTSEVEAIARFRDETTDTVLYQRLPSQVFLEPGEEPPVIPLEQGRLSDFTRDNRFAPLWPQGDAEV